MFSEMQHVWVTTGESRSQFLVLVRQPQVLDPLLLSDERLTREVEDAADRNIINGSLFRLCRLCERNCSVIFRGFMRTSVLACFGVDISRPYEVLLVNMFILLATVTSPRP